MEADALETLATDAELAAELAAARDEDALAAEALLADALEAELAELAEALDWEAFKVLKRQADEQERRGEPR